MIRVLRKQSLSSRSLDPVFSSLFFSRYLAHKVDLLTNEHRVAMIIHLLRGNYIQEFVSSKFSSAKMTHARTG